MCACCLMLIRVLLHVPLIHALSYAPSHASAPWCVLSHVWHIFAHVHVCLCGLTCVLSCACSRSCLCSRVCALTPGLAHVCLWCVPLCLRSDMCVISYVCSQMRALMCALICVAHVCGLACVPHALLLYMCFNMHSDMCICAP